MTRLPDLWHQLTTPRASSQSETRQEYMTRVILVMMSAFMLLLLPFSLIGWWMGALTPDIPLATFVLGICSAGGWQLSECGKWRWGRYLPPAMILVWAWRDTYQYGLGATNIITYSMAIVLTVLLLNHSAHWVTLLFSIGGALLLNCLYIDRQQAAVDLLDVGYGLIVVGGYFIVLTLLLQFFTAQFQRTLEQSRTYSEKLVKEINERQQAEKALRASEARYREIFEGSRDGFVIVNRNGQIIDANQAYCAMLGRSLDELQNLEDFYEITPERWHDWELNEIWENRLLAQGYSGVYEKEYIHKDGSIIPVELQAYAVKGTAGEIQYLWGIARNITDRKQAEEALKSSQEYAQSIIESSLDIIITVDMEQRIVEFNRAAQEAFGYTLEEVLGQHVDLLYADPQDSLVIHQTTTQQGQCIREVFNKRKDGRVFPSHLSASCLRDARGEMVGVMGISRDITGRKEIEERMQRQDRLAAIGQLAAGIAHDFRNLLTTIILYAQLGQRKPGLSPAVGQHLAIIIGEARKATDLVQQILDFSRHTEIDRRPLDLVAFVGDVVAVLQRTLPENIHITFDAPSGVCIVEGDAGRLQQALTNLALNARDAMPDGGDLHIGLARIPVEPGAAPPLPEMVETLAPPAWIHLSVTDTGVGMSEEVYAHLFEPFFTTKEEGEGTGLGLAQVYGIVQLHAGYIDVKTKEGQGTAFHIYLPAMGAAMEQNAPGTTETAPPGRGETLLLVEDNARLREAEQHILTDLGYRVLTAENGREALALHQTEGPIALLITDLVMPEMGGKILMQRLRDRAPRLKALAMTGYTAKESVETLQALGFLDVIRKPFDAATLAQAVRCALDGE
jgi:two-component system, cell cycle sensor histidine kinase and response regulator CckA